jgi:hypothetical protein
MLIEAESSAQDFDDLEIRIKDDAYPLVAEGEYDVQFVKSETFREHRKDKLYVWFEIIEGPNRGTRLFRAYNLYQPLVRGSNLYKDLTLLYGQRLRKNTRLSLKLFRGKILRIAVRTVKLSRKQTPLSEAQQYSVVDRITGIVAGSNGVTQ